jgi:putative redox protein
LSAGDVTGEAVLVEETNHGPFQNKVRTGSSTFLVDEPMGAGGLGSGPNPYDLLSAALGACTTMTVRMYARKKDWPLERARARVEHTREGNQSIDRFVIELELEGPLSDEQRQRLSEIANRCPVHLTMARGSGVQTKVIDRGELEQQAVTRMEHVRDMSALCDELLP